MCEMESELPKLESTILKNYTIKEIK